VLTEIKKCANNGDIKGLRYIFIDCLDVDPTFEKYRSAYKYCKNIKGLFEDYQDLNGLITDQNKWNQQYWEQLKLDLTNNFSEKRFEHMIKVAKVVYANKISRLLNERSMKNVTVEEQNVTVEEQIDGVSNKELIDVISSEDKKRIAEERRKIEENNKKAEAEKRAEEKRIAAKKEELERRNNLQEFSSSKKWLGIVLIVAIIIVVLMIIVLQSNSPQRIQKPL